MKLLYVIIMLSLSGCLYQTVDAHDIEQSSEACKDHKGIRQISANWAGEERAYCNDNYATYINRYKKND